MVQQCGLVVEPGHRVGDATLDRFGQARPAYRSASAGSPAVCSTEPTSCRPAGMALLPPRTGGREGCGDRRAPHSRHGAQPRQEPGRPCRVGNGDLAGEGGQPRVGLGARHDEVTDGEGEQRGPRVVEPADRRTTPAHRHPRNQSEAGRGAEHLRRQQVPALPLSYASGGRRNSNPQPFRSTVAAHRPRPPNLALGASAVVLRFACGFARPVNASHHGCGLRGSAQPPAARRFSAVTVTAVLR